MDGKLTEHLPIDGQTVIRPAKGIRMRSAAGVNMIVCPPGAGGTRRVVRLNDTAAIMWRILEKDGGATCDDMAQALATEYEMEKDGLLGDVIDRKSVV